jgi:transcriptional regulator with XRE-family HTH domain
MNIRELRKKKRISQTELAQMINVSQMKVSRFESDNAIPDAVEIIKLAKALKVSEKAILNIYRKEK